MGPDDVAVVRRAVRSVYAAGHEAFEDAVQEGCIAVWQATKKAGKDLDEALAYRVARCAALDYRSGTRATGTKALPGEKRRIIGHIPTVSLDGVMDSLDHPDSCEWLVDPADIAEDTVRSVSVGAAVAKLSDKGRAYVQQRFWDDLDTRSIANGYTESGNRLYFRTRWAPSLRQSLGGAYAAA